MKQCGADEAEGIGYRDLPPGLSRRGLAEDSQRWKTNWDFLDENFSPGKDLPGSHRDATRRNHQDGKCLTGTLDGNDRTGRRPEAGSSERFSTTRIRLVLIVRGLRQKGIGRRSYLSIWDRAEEETSTISGASERKTRFRHCDNCDINYIEKTGTNSTNRRKRTDGIFKAGYNVKKTGHATHGATRKTDNYPVSFY